MESHYSFGAPNGRRDEYYLVEFDIASCYEYIQHGQLKHEAVYTTQNAEHVRHLITLLASLDDRRTGLPQLLWESDVLAELPLHAIELALVREGWKVSRVADDFRIIAPDWPTATYAIERGAEVARQWGLVLSTEKTNVYSAETLRHYQQAMEEYLDAYYRSAEEDLTEFEVWGGGHYEDDIEVVEIPPEKEEALRAAMKQLLLDWHEERAEHSQLNLRAAPLALKILRHDDERISDDVLADLVFKSPVRLESVAHYLLSRNEQAENWRILSRLTRTGRQSPWAKIWLLFLAANLDQSTQEGSADEVVSWAREQSLSGHEVVRCEAAWYLVNYVGVDLEFLGELYASASTLTRPGLAAGIAVMDPSSSSKLAQTIFRHDPLARAAASWGVS